MAAPAFRLYRNQPMSEPQSPQAYIASLRQDSQSVEVKFKDGIRVVPDWVVAQLGGKEAFERDFVPLLSKKTFGQFMKLHLDTARKQTLQGIADDFINQHFNRIQNRWL